MHRIPSLPASPKTCSKCALPFKEGERIHSVLIEKSGGGFTRKAFCKSCFDADTSAGCFSHWIGTFSGNVRRDRIPPESLCSLLDSLRTNEKSHRIAALAAWHFTRKRLLEFAGDKEVESLRIGVFDEPKSGRRFEFEYFDAGPKESADLADLLNSLDADFSL